MQIDKRKELADIDTVALRLDWPALLTGHGTIQSVQIAKPNVFLAQDRDGRASWDFTDGVDPGKPIRLPVIKDFAIVGGKASLVSLQQNLKFDGTFSANQLAVAHAPSFNLAIQGRLNGKPFATTASGQPLYTVQPNVPYPYHLTVQAGAGRIEANGKILHPFDFADMDEAVTLTGDNLSELFPMTGLVLPDTDKYALSAHVSRRGAIYRIENLNGKVGASDLEGYLTIGTHRRGRPNVTGSLTSRVLDFKALGSVIGATGANTPSMPKASVAPMAGGMKRRFFPDTPLDVDRVRGIDAHVRYRAITVHAPAKVPIRNLSLGISLDRGLLVLDPIEIGLVHGKLTGAARIDARTSVQHNSVDLHLVGMRTEDIFSSEKGSPPLEGRLDAWTHASGDGNTVHKAVAKSDGSLTVVMPGGEIRQSLAELMGIDATKGLFLLLSKDKHETNVRCAVAEFHVHNGLMQAQKIVLDTGVVLVNGSGDVDLTSESIRLSLKGTPKKFRLVRIDAPIAVGGHLAAPKFGLGTGEGSGGKGLKGAVSTVLPFLNLYAKDADCSGLLRQAAGH